MKLFKGTATAIITPFHEDGQIDYESFELLLAKQKESRINSIVLLGTTGECPVINFEERKKLIQFTKNYFRYEIPLIVGTGSNSPEHVIQLNKQAEELKVDGLLVVNPYYNKSTQEGLVDYYTYISNHTELPIILYNVPSRTGMNVTPSTILSIHKAAPSVCAVKEASGDISQINRLIAEKPDSLSVYSGNDDQTLPVIAIGGEGVISVSSNIVPAEMKLLTDSALHGDYKKAQSMNNKLNSLIESLFIETNPAPVKYACSKLELCKNVLRRPFVPITEKTRARIDMELKKAGLL